MRSQNMICPSHHSSRFSQNTKSRVKEASQKAVSGGYCQETKHTTATCNMWWSKHVGPGIWPLKVLPGHRPSVLVDAERLTWDTMIHGTSKLHGLTTGGSHSEHTDILRQYAAYRMDCDDAPTSARGIAIIISNSPVCYCLQPQAGLSSCTLKQTYCHLLSPNEQHKQEFQSLIDELLEPNHVLGDLSARTGP